MNEEFPLVVFIEAKTNSGEDGKPVTVKNGSERLVIGVFDGLGGRSAGYGGKTGGRIASGLASDLTQNFLEKTHENFSEQDAIELQKMICQSLKKEADEKIKPSRIKGTLVKDRLCTTLAIASISRFNTGDNCFNLSLAWIGDSRIYFLSPSKGLQQLTKDDLTEDNDAFELIRKDPPMSQYITADMDLHPNWQINFKKEEFTEKGCVIACTDGCFQYLESPWNFEKLILDTLAGSESIEGWRNLLRAEYEKIKQDDISFVLQPVGIENFDDLKSLYSERQQIINSFSSESSSYEELKNLWNGYRQNYEKWLAVPYEIISDIPPQEVIDTSSSSQDSQSSDIPRGDSTEDNLDKEVNSDSSSVANKSDDDSKFKFLEYEKLELIQDLEFSEQIQRLFKKADIYEQQKYWNKLINICTKILEFKPENLYHQYKIALAYYELGKLYENLYIYCKKHYHYAYQVLKKIIEDAERKNIAISIDVKKKYIFLLQRINKHNEAIIFGEETINMYPKEYYIFYIIGIIYEEKNIYKKALEYYQKAIFIYKEQSENCQNKRRIKDLEECCDGIKNKINQNV